MALPLAAGGWHFDRVIPRRNSFDKRIFELGALGFVNQSFLTERRFLFPTEEAIRRKKIPDLLFSIIRPRHRSEY